MTPETIALLNRLSAETNQRTRAQMRFTDNTRSLLRQAYQEYDPEKWESELRDVLLVFLSEAGMQNVKDLYVTAVKAVHINKEDKDNG